jgi:hypothetical protein
MKDKMPSTLDGSSESEQSVPAVEYSYEDEITEVGKTRIQVEVCTQYNDGQENRVPAITGTLSTNQDPMPVKHENTNNAAQEHNIEASGKDKMKEISEKKQLDNHENENAIASIEEKKLKPNFKTSSEDETKMI